jgi:putative hydrolase of the HAD superfamily
VDHAVRAVLFDLDNTLADRDSAFAAWARWFARERLGLSDGVSIAEIVTDLIALDAGGRAPKDAMFRALKERHVGLTEPVDALVAAFREQLLAHLPPLDPAAGRLLAALADARVPWGIVSNGSSSQLLKIRKLELDALAGCVVISEIVGARKPDPAIFRAAAEHLGVAPADVLFVGDHPEADVLGAAGAGMQTAWLRRGQPWPADLASFAPNYAIESLAELLWVVDNGPGQNSVPTLGRASFSPCL